jgi:hypothetical protein
MQTTELMTALTRAYGVCSQSVPQNATTASDSANSRKGLSRSRRIASSFAYLNVIRDDMRRSMRQGAYQVLKKRGAIALGMAAARCRAEKSNFKVSNHRTIAVRTRMVNKQTLWQDGGGTEACGHSESLIRIEFGHTPASWSSRISERYAFTERRLKK